MQKSPARNERGILYVIAISYSGILSTAPVAAEVTSAA